MVLALVILQAREGAEGGQAPRVPLAEPDLYPPPPPRAAVWRPGPQLYLALSVEQSCGSGAVRGGHASHSFPTGLWGLLVHLSQDR